MSNNEKIYSWDVTALIGWSKYPQPKENLSHPIKENKKLVSLGLLNVSNEVVNSSYYEKKYKSSSEVTEKGKMLIDTYIKHLEKRWPVSKVPLIEDPDGSKTGPPPHFAMYESSKGNIFVYDDGVDFDVAWHDYAGYRESAPIFSTVLSRNWRPWFNSTCFLDFSSEIPMMIDSMGIPVVGGNPQMLLNAMYAFLGDANLEHLKSTCSRERHNNYEIILDLHTIPDRIAKVVGL